MGDAPSPAGPPSTAPARGLARRRVARLRDGRWREEEDFLVEEEPLEIRVDGESLAVTMRTPGRDGDLALGFLLAEGLVAGAADVGSIAHCGRPGEEGFGNVIDVHSAGGHRIDPDRILEGRRRVATTSACGVCGRRTVDDLLARCGAVEADTRLPSERVSALVARLGEVQPVFARTGGLHAAAAFSADGALLAAAEDVGRHNAVDKVVGALARTGSVGRAPSGRPPGPRPAILAVSGRAGFEIVQKAAAAAIPVVASVSAPSSLAVELAESSRIALLGFVREGRLNVYSCAWRVEGAGAPLPGSPP
jgi:FdhD protein